MYILVRYFWWPNMDKCSSWRRKKSLAKGWSCLHEFEVGLRSGQYLLVPVHFMNIYYTSLNCNSLHSTALHYTALHSIAHCNILHLNILYRIALHFLVDIYQTILRKAVFAPLCEARQHFTVITFDWNWNRDVNTLLKLLNGISDTIY